MLWCRCETRESARNSDRTRRSTGHAFFGQNGAIMATPPEFTQIAACDFDKAVIDTIGTTCHVVLSDMQRTEVRSALRKGVWDCSRLLTKLRLLTLLLGTLLASCAPGSGTATEGSTLA